MIEANVTRILTESFYCDIKLTVRGSGTVIYSKLTTERFIHELHLYYVIQYFVC